MVTALSLRASCFGEDEHDGGANIGVPIVMGVPQQWMVDKDLEGKIQKWMMTRGAHTNGNFHIAAVIPPKEK